MCAMDSQQAEGRVFLVLYICVRVCVNGNEKSLSLIWNGKKVDSKRERQREEKREREKAALRRKKRLKVMKNQA